MDNNCFYGIPKIYMIWHGQWSDPEIMYKEKLYNYWDIEGAFYSMWEEEKADGTFEGTFEDWMMNNHDTVYGYFDDLEMME